MTISTPSIKRRVLVTVGATAPFAALCDEVISDKLLKTLAEHGITSLDIQCGAYKPKLDIALANVPDRYGVAIKTFDFDSALSSRLKRMRGEMGVSPAGIVIGHAGTGTLSEVLKFSIPFIVVANPLLMDNHQAPLAREYGCKPGVVEGLLGGLEDAIPAILTKIAQGGMDSLEPYQDPVFPVAEKDRLKFIDRMMMRAQR